FIPSDGHRHAVLVSRRGLARVRSLMTHITRATIVSAVLTAAAVPHAQTPAAPQQDVNAYYQLGPDSLSHDGVPKGEMRGPLVLPSQAYPGTQHTYWVYVPKQYDRAVAASL